MLSTGDIISILAILVGIGIPVFIWLWRKYNSRPELTIELRFDNGQSMPIGYSNKNTAVNGVIEMRNAIQVFELKWTFYIIIRNNSENTAFYPKLLFKNGQPKPFKIDKLNGQEPIPGKGKIELKVGYKETEECLGTQRSETNSIPPALSNFKILLEYKNSSKINYYSLYNHKFKETRKFSYKPKGYDEN